MPILSKTEQQTFKPISPNWVKASKEINGVSKYDQLALEVERSKLQPLVGVELLQDLQNNPSTPENSELLNGSSFVCDSVTIYFEGLKYAIAYLNFYQYVSESYVSDTYTGFVQKNRPESEMLSSSARKELRENAKQVFDSEWSLIVRFLNANKDDYPLWKCTIVRPFRPVITTLRKTRN